MIGDTVVTNNEYFEVVWSGGELLPARETKPSWFWEPPKRMYNKKSSYWKTAKTAKKNREADIDDTTSAADAASLETV